MKKNKNNKKVLIKNNILIKIKKININNSNKIVNYQFILTKMIIMKNRNKFIMNR